MPKTSDYCPRCKSVQVGLRRADGEFLCLNCSTKHEVAEAASVPVRVHRAEDLRSSKSLGTTALVLGFLSALVAVPITLYFDSAGDASTALLVIIPASLMPLGIGLLAGRNRRGQLGAALSLLACIQVFFHGPLLGVAWGGTKCCGRGIEYASERRLLDVRCQP